MTAVTRTLTHVRRRLVASSGAALAVVLLASGCGSSVQAGAAAVLGESQVTTTQVADQVAEVHRLTGVPVDQPDADLTRSTVERLVTVDLVEQAAAQAGATVSQGALDSALAAYAEQLGGQAEVEKAFLEQGIPPSAIEDTARLSLLAAALGEALVPDGDAEAQSQAAYEAVVALSDELDVTVSARFGTWDAEQLAVGPVPTDLAAPPSPSTDALPTELPSP